MNSYLTDSEQLLMRAFRNKAQLYGDRADGNIFEEYDNDVEEMIRESLGIQGLKPVPNGTKKPTTYRTPWVYTKDKVTGKTTRQRFEISEES